MSKNHEKRETKVRVVTGNRENIVIFFFFLKKKKKNLTDKG
jgi:hypothetical protein